MSKTKKNTKAEEKVKSLSEQIYETVAGLKYISETDAEIIPFIGGATASVTSAELCLQSNRTDNLRFEEKDFEEFFSTLVKSQKWFGEEERKMTERFVDLEKLLRENLIQKKFFRIGKKEIDIYVVGLDKENRLCGIKTKAVET